MNHTLKKQNRVLLITLVVILTAAAVLVAVTGGANRKNKEENPPLDPKTSETVPAETETPAAAKRPQDSAPINRDDAESGKNGGSTVKEKAAAEKKDSSAAESEKKQDNVKESTAESGKTAAAASLQSDLLPVFTLPIDAPVSKGFSGEVPVFSYTMNDYRTHTGIDFACSAGTEVKAAADGTVCEVRDDPMMGVTVGIRHTGGAVTWYKGLSEESLTLVRAGDEIKRGQVIGSAGSTALIESAEDDHMHFELQVNGAYENPGEFMKVQYLADMPED